MNPVLQVENLSKSYPGLKAVDNLSFTVNPGEVYGFLGQNGAGKSTTIRMLLTLVQPSGGSIRIFGKELHQHRQEILRQVGAVIERPDLYKYLSAIECLSLFARMSGLRFNRETLLRHLDMVGLKERADSKVKTFSQGMKQRLGIAVALVHDPGFIILDEPTNGLDPQGIADVRNLILHLSRHSGKTILVSSHLLSEIELIADRMLIIDKGRKVVEGSVKELFDPTKMLVEVELANFSELQEAVRASSWAAFLKESRESSFIFQLDKNAVPSLTEDLLRWNARIMAVKPRHSLEDYFLTLTSANQHVDHFTN